MPRRTRKGGERKSAGRDAAPSAATGVFDFPIWPLGKRTQQMRDNVYVLERGHLFTSASVARKVTMSCYAMIVLSAQGAPFLMQVGREARAYRAVAVRPPLERAVFADDIRLTSIHLNPLHPRFRCFRSISGAGMLELPREAFSALDADLNQAYEGKLAFAAAELLFEKVIAVAGSYLPEPPAMDPRIKTIVELIDTSRDVTLPAMAAEVGLSTNRLTHLFTQSIGISLRSYLLWRKIHRVPQLLAAGKTFTAVAHECGFVDSAHFTSAFQNLYGAAPTYFFNSEHVRMLSWARV